MGISEFVVHSPTEGLLCYFPGLVIMNKATISIHVQVFCGHKFSNQFDKYMGVQLLDHMIMLCLILEENINCLPKYLYYFSFPLAMNENSCCSAFSLAAVIVSL